VHERIACIGHSFLTNHLADMHPTTRGLFSSALNSKLEAWQVFRDQGLQAKFTREADRLFTTIDVLVTPTAPSHPTIEEMASEPIACNAKVGIFTHAANVVDLCAVSVNAGFVEGGLPFGVQFLGGSGKDGRVLDIVAVFEEEVKMKKGMTNGI
jgi:Asp-tRNA(Asn)/Glu-tRNA(Gln) amidotransferase A subunit family amidase